MSGRPASRLAFFVPGVVCLAVAASLIVPMSRRLGDDMYWTPPEQARTLDEVADRVEVYVDGDLLQRRAETGQLRLDGHPLAADEVTVRLNNADRAVRMQELIATATASAGLALLIAGLLLPRAARRRPPRS